MSVIKKKKKKKKKRLNKNNLPSANKLSAVILEFVKPLSERIDNDEMNKSMIQFGILVWNISLFPMEDREKQKDSIIKRLVKDKQIEDEFNEIYDYLISRKDSLFKNDRRFVVDYVITEQENIFNLTIGSTKLINE
ncbi:hypothetical protein [Desulfitobacterium sp.]|uniref:hypothetical protein n=1 Tax=Desulfitobacterium sp. TaxID=49981 RepID=UPI002C698F0A|nr:hypothetical protein [Desulfitobacterium sp.]HVJ49601.1 hypothetical protein [Desulfitobacterium sp.]